MELNNCKCTKTSCEKYSLTFDNGQNWAIFTIDNTGMFNCQTAFGDYNFLWGSFGNNFKKFLIGLQSDYLYTKLCNENYFNIGDYLKKCRKLILKLYKAYEITREQANELRDFYCHEIDSCSSYDITCQQVWSNKTLNEIYGEVIYSDFFPEKDYSPQMNIFVNDIYPMFVEILKKELDESKSIKI